MYRFALALLVVSTVYGEDQAALALSSKAQTDFDRVEIAAVPQVRDAAACEQSQAALLTISGLQDAPGIHYRKGYCALAGATLTHEPGGFTSAAAEFEKAIVSWPDRMLKAPKNSPPERVPSGLRALVWIARLEAETQGNACRDISPAGAECSALRGAKNDLALALQSHACPAGVMMPAFCEAVLGAARDWLGWMALQQDDLFEAQKHLSASASPWRPWAAGEQAFSDRKYADAAARFEEAIAAWRRLADEPAPGLAARLTPRPLMGQALAELGGAQLLAGDPAAATRSLDAAVKADPANAQAYYLRGRAREAAGETEAALADYSLATRTAFAAAKDLASGEAHFYRGVGLYLRKDYKRAEDEFSSALNFDVPAKLKPTVEAWRYMAAVAGGSCESSRERLERALETASPFFPRNEARAVAGACMVPATTAAKSSLSGAVR